MSVLETIPSYAQFVKLNEGINYFDKETEFKNLEFVFANLLDDEVCAT